VPTLILGEHRDNIEPIRPGEVQEGQVHVGQELTVEEVRVATHLDENEDPEYILNVKVRNVGLGTIERYSVNVWLIA
jgi:hypothetical protein